MQIRPICWLFFLCLFPSSLLRAQSIGIGTTAPDSSAVLDITGTVTKGLLIPRMGYSLNFNATHPAKGLMFLDTVQNRLMVNIGTPNAPDFEDLTSLNNWTLGGNHGTGNQLGTLDLGKALSFVSGGAVSGTIATGEQTTFFGYSTTGAIGLGNTGFGAYTLSKNTTGGDDVAVGTQALAANTTGTDNTGVGTYALEFNTVGQANTAVGHSALYNDQGNDNTAVGVSALGLNTDGNYNTAVGYQSLNNTSHAWYNTVIGYNSGTQYELGYNNVFIGANNDASATNMFNVIAIGQGVICTASSQARIGNSATNSIGGYANWTNFSDGRYKKNMQENVKGLDFILKLRPITYNLDVTGINTHLGAKSPKDAGTQQAIHDRETTVFSGFSAQEVEKAAAAAGYDFSGVDKPKNANDFYGLRYSDFVVPLVKAVQEQQQLISTMQKRIDALEQQNQLLLQSLKK